MKYLIYILNEHVWGYVPLPLQTNLGKMTQWPVIKQCDEIVL